MDDLSVALNNSGIGGYLGDALYAYLFSSICVIMKITLFSKLYYLVIYMNKLVIQIRNL